MQNDPRGGFVQLARLDAHQAVLHVVDAAHPVFATQLVEALDQWYAVEMLAVECHRPALLEGDLHVGRLVGRLARVGGPGVRFLRWLVPRILQDARLAAAAPQVLVDAVGAFDGRLDGDVVLAGELDLGVAGHLPFADRGDDLEVRGQCLKRDIETHLVVAFAGAAVGDRLGPVLAGHVHHQLGDQRPAQRRGERIFPLIHCAGH